MSESSLNTITKPFSFLSRCNISCDSPCFSKLCCEVNHCIYNLDTHEYVSDEEDKKKSNNPVRNDAQPVIIFICFA